MSCITTMFMFGIFSCANFSTLLLFLSSFPLRIFFLGRLLLKYVSFLGIGTRNSKIELTLFSLCRCHASQQRLLLAIFHVRTSQLCCPSCRHFLHGLFPWRTILGIWLESLWSLHNPASNYTENKFKAYTHVFIIPYCHFVSCIAIILAHWIPQLS